jgi:hypothetical protein
MSTFNVVNAYRWAQLTGSERELAVQFICPNGEPLTDDGVAFFFSLLKAGTIAFAQSDTANEHLHVPHQPSEAKYFCTSCHARQLLSA